MEPPSQLCKSQSSEQQGSHPSVAAGVAALPGSNHWAHLYASPSASHRSAQSLASFGFSSSSEILSAQKYGGHDSAMPTLWCTNSDVAVSETHGDDVRSGVCVEYSRSIVIVGVWLLLKEKMFCSMTTRHVLKWLWSHHLGYGMGQDSRRAYETWEGQRHAV